MKNRFKIALRRLLGQRVYTLINLIGLVTGVTSTILILHFVKYERSFDSFHSRFDNIYRVRLERVSETGETVDFASTAPPVGLRIRDQFPEADVVARLLRYKGTLSFDDLSYYEEKIFFAEPQFLTMFDFKVLSGNPVRDLGEQGKLFLTSDMARKYFGSTDPVGKNLRLDGKWVFMVAGILDNPPDNSHLKFDFLISWADIRSIYGPSFEEAWGHTGVFTYALLHPGTDIEATGAKLTSLVEKEFGEALKHYKLKMTLPLQPLSEIHFGPGYMQEPEPNGDRTTVNGMLIVAILIIFIAWVNYIVLYTAELIRRMSETGLRKILGAGRKEIMLELLAETTVVNLVAIILSVLAILITSPLLEPLTGFSFHQVVTDRFVLLSLPAFFTAGIIFTGLYPVILISSANTTLALKGKQSASALNIMVRKILVVLQNGIALVISFSTLVIWLQYSHIENADRGIELDNIVAVKAPRIRPDNYTSAINGFAEELRKLNDVSSVAMATEIPGRQLYWDAGGIFKVGSDQSKNYQILGVDYNYAGIFGLKFLAGRNFSPEFPTDSMGLILTEKAALWMDIASPDQAIGVKVNYWDEIYTIIGVVEDFRQRSAMYEPEPTIIRFLPEGRNLMGNILIKTNTENSNTVVESVRKIYSEFFPGNSFDYYFTDDYYNDQFEQGRDISKLFALFTLVSLLILIMGVTGLTKYVLDQQKKSISIRKAMGDNSPGIILRFVKSFLMLIIISSLMAFPISWIILSGWLETFPAHIRLQPAMFLIPLVLLLVYTGLTVTLIVYRESAANPAKNLRNE